MRQKLENQVRLKIFKDNPHNTSRKIAAGTGISQRSVLRILKDEMYHPYRIQLHQELNEHDPDPRLKFCKIMQDLFNRNPLLNTL